MGYVPKYLKLQRESEYMGSIVSGSNTYYIDIVDESMNPDQGFIEAETAGYLEQRQRLPGGYMVAGDIGTLVDAHSILPILHVFTGSYAVGTPSSNVVSYVFKPTLNTISCRAALNPNVKDSSAYKTRTLRGFVIKGIEVTAAAREACAFKMTCQASKDEQSDRDSGVTFSSVRPMSFTDGLLADMTLGGDSVAIESLSLRSERVVADDNFVLGSRYLPFIHAAGFNCSGTLAFGFRDWDVFKRFWGSASSTSPDAVPGSYALSLKFTGDTIRNAKKFFLKIDVPKCYLDTTNAQINKRERIVQNVDFTGIYDTSSSCAVSFTVQADKADTGDLWKAGD
jgi:hypothetical protein